jgi:hypothetical protein
MTPVFGLNLKTGIEYPSKRSIGPSARHAFAVSTYLAAAVR